MNQLSIHKYQHQLELVNSSPLLHVFVRLARYITISRSCRMGVEQIKRGCNKHHTLFRHGWVHSVQTETSQSGVPWKLSPLAVDQQHCLEESCLPESEWYMHISVGSGICASRKNLVEYLHLLWLESLLKRNVNNYKISAFSPPNVRLQTLMYLEVPSIFVYVRMYEWILYVPHN